MRRDSNGVVTTPTPTSTPFGDLDQYIALPRLGGLALSPDGTRLVVAMNVLDPKRTRYVTALWEVDPQRGARCAPADPQREGRERRGVSSRWVAAVRLGPPRSGGSRPTTSRSRRCGASLSAVARRASWRRGRVASVASSSPPTAAPSSSVPTHLPGSVTAEDDTTRRTARKDNKVTAILHETYPIRFWDHDLGPDTPRLMVGEAPGD